MNSQNTGSNDARRSWLVAAPQSPELALRNLQSSTWQTHLAGTPVAE